MKESMEAQTKWKAEELRAERKARLAEMKSKDGGKKPVKTSNRLVTAIVIVVLVLALIGTGIWGAFRLGLPQQRLTALTVGSEKINVVEMNYYYHNLATQFQIDPSDPASEQTLKSDSGIEGFATVEDYLKDMAAQQVQMNVMLASKANQDGVTLDETYTKMIDDFFAEVEAEALRNQTSVNASLVSLFGRGATKDAIRPVLERYLLAQKYASEKQSSFEVGDDEINTYYNENKDDYDRVSYRIFDVPAEITAESTDTQKEEAMKKAKEKASEMLAEVTDEDSFREACLTYAKDEAERASYEETDKSKVIMRLKSSISVSQAADWLFESERTKFDKTIIETTTGYQVVMFLEHTDSDFSYVDVNHILISASRTEATDEQIKAAGDKAESILAEYQSGAKGQDAFAALAVEYSEDGNAASGGLYEDVYPGQMVAEFEQWLFDSSRKPGDTGIVQTSYGFHVMYYAGADGQTDREIRVSDTLRSQKYQNFLNENLPQYPYDIDSFGFRFTT